MDNRPLVSVFIITYNSSDYVLEALESVKNQTYHNIELIVSDDCSTDKTVDIVKSWIHSNESRFVNTRLITAEKNTGVSGNVNRARMLCSGVWLKGFAGDDVLLPNCIEDNMNYVKLHPDAKVILSNSLIFFDDKKKEIVQKPGLLVPGFFDLSAEEQYEKLVRYDILMNTNSQFTKTDFSHATGCDERFQFMEDSPFYWNCTKNGTKIHYFDKETVKYRKHEGALTGNSGKKITSLEYFDSWSTFFFAVRKLEMEKRGISVSYDEKRVLWYLFIKYVLKNKGNFVTKVLNKYVEKWLYK